LYTEVCNVVKETFPTAKIIYIPLARFQANEPEMMLPLQDLSPLKHVSTVFAKQTYR